MNEQIKCENCGHKHGSNVDCSSYSKLKSTGFSEKAKAALGRIRALEVKVQSYEAQRSNAIQP